MKRCLALLFAMTVAMPVLGQQAESGGEEVSDERFEQLSGRYWKILSRRPRRGTAFDAWYQLYLDAGRLDELLKRATDHCEAEPDSGAAHLLLGLVRERRGEDAQALEEYASATRLSPKDYYGFSLLGLLHARRFEFEEASTALAEAVALKPPRSELLEMYKRLGQLQLRRGRTDDALQTWARIAELFPRDRQVHRELAQLLGDEGQHETAIQTWQRVVELSASDPYQALKARIEIAQLHVPAGRTDTAIRHFGEILDSVKPDGWAAEDVRTRLETTFLKSNDHIGLITWCQKRLERRPDDLETWLLLASAQSRSGERQESLVTYRETLKLAPARRDIREAFVQELLRGDEIEEALKQCETLTAAHPRDVELLLLHGTVHLRHGDDQDDPAADRERAIAVWEEIASIRPDDATLAVQVAEACRQAAGLSTQDALYRSTGSFVTDSPLLKAAEKWYREALRREPTGDQFHEYLGEFLHASGRGDEAVAAWARMLPEGSNDATGWHRLATVYSQFGYIAPAREAADKAAELAPDNFEICDFRIGLLLDADEAAEAEGLLDQLDQAAETPVEEESALKRRVSVLAANGRIQEEIRRLHDLADSPNVTARDQWLLGLMLANRWRFNDASRAYERALTVSPDDVRILRAHAATLERTGDGREAITAYRALVTRPGVNRTAIFEKIVDLELRLGRAPQARAAAAELAALTPTGLDGFLLRARVAFRTGAVDDGLDTLRSAIRIAPRDVMLRDRLAQALADHGQIDESLEHYWRCFELSEDLSGRLSFVAAIAEVAAGAKKLDDVIETLRHLGETREDARTMTLCLVEALRVGRRLPQAQAELARLLEARPHDLDVLHLTVNLATLMEEWETAVSHQRRITALDTTAEPMRRLAWLLVQGGDQDGATEIWKQMLVKSNDDTQIVSTIDRRLRAGEFKSARELAVWARELAPDNWRLLYRCGYSSLAVKDATAAAGYFEECRARLVDVVATRRRRYGSGASRTGSTARQGLQVGSISALPAFRDIYAAQTTAMAFNRLLSLQAVPSPSSSQARNYARQVASAVRLPSDAGDARLAVDLALHFCAQKAQTVDAYLDAFRDRAKGDPELLRRLLLVRATGGASPDEEVLNELAECDRDDPLPHLARFYSTTSAPKATGRDVERMRELATSFEWIEQHRPDLRADALYSYVWHAIQLKTPEIAANLLRREMESAQRLTDLNALPALAFLVEHESFADEFVVRLGELARTTEADERPRLTEVMGLVVSQDFDQFRNPDQIEAILSGFDRLLTITPYDNQADVLAFWSAQPTATRNVTSFRVLSTNSSPQAALRVRQQLFIQQYNQLNQQLAALRRTGASGPRVASIQAQQARLRAQLQAFTQNPTGTSSPLFAQPNPFLPIENAILLDQLLNQTKTINESDRLLAHLEKGLSECEPSRRNTWVMARYTVLQGLDRKSEAAAYLQEHCDAHPEDTTLRLVGAQALFLNQQPVAALESLNRLQPGATSPDAVPSPETSTDSNLPAITPEQVAGFRQRIWQSLPSASVQVLLEAIVAELENPAGPLLGPAFARGTRLSAAQTRALMNSGFRPGQVPNTSYVPAPVYLNRATGQSGGVPQAAPISRVIRAEELKDEDFVRLEAAASRRWESSPKPQQLSALLALVRLRLDDHAGALAAVSAFNDRIEDPETAKSLPMLLATHCLPHAETREAGFRLAQRISPFPPTNMSVSDLRELVKFWTAAYVAEGRPDEAQRVFRDAWNEINRQLSQQSRPRSNAMPLHRGAELLAAVHPGALSRAVAEITERDKGELKAADKADSYLIAYRLTEAVQAALPSLTPEQKQELLDRLVGLLFHQGATEPPSVLRWYKQTANPPSGALGKIVIDLAHQTGQLEALRDQWIQHAHADSPGMLALRAEAALLLEDKKTVESLTRKAWALRQMEVRIPVWSPDILDELFADRTIARWILEQNNGTISTAPGGLISRASRLPAGEFAVVIIRMPNNKDVDDAVLERLARLPELKTLVISGTSITDDGLKHLGGVPNLTYLDLDGTSVSDEGLMHLARHGKLKTVRVRRTNVTPAGVAALKSHVPNCHVDIGPSSNVTPAGR